MKPDTNSFVEIIQLMGKTFKKLRSEKHFTLEDVSDKGLSISELSSFERGQTKLSAPALFAGLQNINVNAYEFQYLYNETLREKDHLLYNEEINSAYMEASVPRLKILLNAIKKERSLDPDKKKLKLDEVHLEGVLCLLDPDYNPEKEHIIFLKNYLMHLNNWGIKDIQLFGQCLSLFDLSTLKSLSQRMIDMVENSASMRFHFTQDSFISTLTNLAERCIDLKNYKQAHDYINYLETFDIHEYQMFQKFTLVYTKAKLNYLEKEDNESLAIMEKCKEVLDFCGCFKTELMVEKEIEKMSEDHK